MPSVTLTKMGASIAPLNYLWKGTVKGADGKFYGIPADSEDILIIDPVTQTATRSKMGATIPSGGNKWWNGVLAANGKIYCAPWNSQDFLVIDTNAGTATVSTLGLSLSGTTKWTNPAIGNDGNVYAFPYSASGVLKIDTTTDTASIVTYGLSWSGIRQYFGAVVGSDGLVYGTAADATSIPRINGLAGTCVRNNMGATISSQALKWRGGALSTYNNKIYAAMNSGSYARALEIDVPNGTAITISNTWFPTIGDSWFSGGIEGAENKIYFIPHSYPYVGIVDPVSGVYSYELFGMPYDTGVGKWGEGAIDDDGTIYAAPYYSEYIFVMKTANPKINTNAGRFLIRRTLTDLKANKFAIPEASGRTGLRLSKKNYTHEYTHVMHAGDTISIAIDWDDLLIGSQETILTFGAESRDLTVGTITFDARHAFIQLSDATTTDRAKVTMRVLTSDGRELVRDIIVRTQYEPPFPVVPTP